MTREALKTLFHPFDIGELTPPAKSERILFLGAEPGFRLPEDFTGKLTFAQGFRPWFNALKAAGHDVHPLPQGEGHDLCLVLAGRHRGENQQRIAEALFRARSGAVILVAGAKDDGVAALRKTVEKLVPLDGALPKYHGIVFWFRCPDDAASMISALSAGVEAGPIEGRFHAAPGMFSHDRVDAGSRLLAQHLPAGAKGVAADFGAGWGFLSAVLAERSPALSRIDLYEADYLSLEAAKKNLASIAAPPFGFFWHDLIGEKVTEKYELIIMNPPFHQGRAAEPDIGRAMIAAAASALKSGGRLFMVANRGLPYDKVLAGYFKEWSEVMRDDRYRIFSARR